jgi:hypothetical protein
MTARCYRCTEERPVEEFYRVKSKASGRKSILQALRYRQSEALLRGAPSRTAPRPLA